MVKSEIIRNCDLYTNTVCMASHITFVNSFCVQYLKKMFLKPV